MSVITPTQFDSDSLLSDIEHHFRVAAGPGAGKTHWLVNHLKNVLHNSKRLAKTRNVACITYTNTAVETILKRLGTTSDRVDVSTIHSFLYRHIVKPYVSFVASEYNVTVSEIDGHDDIVLSSYGFINDWKTKTGQQRIRDDDKIIKAFKKIKWKFNAAGELIPVTDHPHKVDGYSIKNDSYLVYKTMAWEKGILHHEDVLFFSFQIIKKFPFVLEILRYKFPYFFIDEFQDSNPIQVSIVKSIVQSETVLGIIGDKAQSIYRFQGADPSQFSGFTLPGMQDYIMVDNRRSSNEIVAFLNTIRTDIIQNPKRNVSTLQPTLLIGSMNLALLKAKAISTDGPVYSLSRDNITSNALKKEMNGLNLDSKLFDELLDTDKASSGNGYRSKLIASCIKAVEYANLRKFKDAIKELGREFKRSDKAETKKESLKHLMTLLAKYNDYKTKSLYDFFLFVKSDIKPEISNMRTGVIKTFYEDHTYLELSLCVNVPEEVSQNRTIHKSKGDEFDNVMLVLQDEKDLSFILAPDLNGASDSHEEQRINYVAVSRAKNKLFISIPALNPVTRAMLISRFQIEDV